MQAPIGKKIKELRRSLNLTQSQLAEPEITKGMLSHIENGYANPSMKNLEYLAKKLGMPISYFLQEDDSIETSTIKQEDLPEAIILETLKSIDNDLQEKNYPYAHEKLNKLLSLYSFNKRSKLYADIIYRSGICNIRLGNSSLGENLINECCNVYIDNKLYIEAARANLRLVDRPILDYKYNECLKIITKSYDLYSNSSSKDIFLEIELLVTQPAIYFSLGDFDLTINLCKKAIEVSKENNIYYHIDDAYRLKAIIYLIQEDYVNFLIAAEESRKYAEFTANKFNLVRIYHNLAKYENKTNNPNKALKYLDLLLENANNKTFFYYLEHGKSNYLLGNYSSALDDLNQIDFNERPIHLADCIYLSTGMLYMGLSNMKYSNLELGKKYADAAIKKLSEYSQSEYKGIRQYANNELVFAHEALSEIYSQLGDFQEAYNLLKKSNNYKPIHKS